MPIQATALKYGVSSAGHEPRLAKGIEIAPQERQSKYLNRARFAGEIRRIDPDTGFSEHESC
jgi:hypothetical protein